MKTRDSMLWVALVALWPLGIVGTLLAVFVVLADISALSEGAVPPMWMWVVTGIACAAASAVWRVISVVEGERSRGRREAPGFPVVLTGPSAGPTEEPRRVIVDDELPHADMGA